MTIKVGDVICDNFDPFYQYKILDIEGHDRVKCMDLEEFEVTYSGNLEEALANYEPDFEPLIAGWDVQTVIFSKDENGKINLNV